MQKKLTKQESTDRDAHVAKLRELQAKVEDEISEFNAKMGELFSPVQSAVEAYNAAVQEAEGFRSDINSQQESDYEEKSDRWQEGDAGQAFNSWKDAWGESLDEVEVEKPDDLEVPDMDHADRLEGMPEEADSV